MDRPQSAIIIGAGVVGIATAYALARRGIAVTIVDSADGPAMGSSHANGAQLSYRYTDALASRSILKELPRLAMARDPAFRMHWHMDWHYLSWLGRFLRNCTNGKFEKHTLAGLELADKSSRAMASLLQRHAIDFGHKTNGKLQIYRDHPAFKRACWITGLKKGGPGDQQILTPAAAAEVEPALADSKQDLVGAIYTASEQVGDPHIFCREMMAILRRDYGVYFSFGQAVEKITHGKNKTMVALADGNIMLSDVVILCTGSHSRRLLAPLGLSLPVQPMKGYSFEMPFSDGSPKTSITDPKKRTVFTNLGDRIRVAGLADLGDHGAAMREDRRNMLVDLAQQSLPDAGRYGEAGKFWAGHRPMTPNSLPIISNPLPGIAINTGHGMLGWTMAMGSGERLADILVTD